MFLTNLLDRRWRHPALVPLFFLALALLLRSFSFVAAVIDTDEGLYMLQAREWLDGKWPIVAVWDMHPVGVPAIFAVFIATFGDDIWVLRVLGAVCVAAAASALFSAVRYAGGPPALGLAAGVLYIADTNNHAIRTIDLGTKLVATLTIEGLTPPPTWSYLRRTT